MLTILKRLFQVSPSVIVRAPSEQWLEDADDEVEFTPDLWNMERRQLQLLFVYDEMMQGHHGHDLIKEHSVSLAAAYTEDKFILWRKNLGKKSYPIPLVKKYLSVPSARIKGQLYGILPPQFKELDKHKLNGVSFIRVRVNIQIPYRRIVKMREEQGTVKLDEEIQRVRAWMYIGVPNYWDDQIDSGFLYSPTQIYHPNREWLDKYYYFSQKEYDVA